MNIFRLILNLLLAVAVLFMGFKLYKTIEEPIVFEKQKKVRDAANIEKLTKIRSSQIAYKTLYGKYAADFDTLLTVIKSDSFDVVKRIGDPNDSTIVVRTEIFKHALLDSLFKGNKTEVDSLPYIPFTKPPQKYDIQADIITKNEVEIPAFEVSAPYKVVYNGMVKRYYADKLNENMQVGSMKDGTTAGNWDGK